MTNKREQKITIPNAEDTCSIDLTLSGINGDDIVIPLGVVETQTVDDKKPDTEKTQTIALTPKIFNDAGFNKNLATAPDFITDEKDIPAEAACGYIYLFVDGFLWREIACIGNGMLSDVDLMQEQGKSIRKNHSTAALQFIIPTKTKSLYNGDALSPVVVEMAFSRVQWSWQYINDLGGMYANDKRFAKHPLLSKCMDETRAKALRESRCQTFDFSETAVPSEHQYIETEKNHSIIYLHDMLGIAQRYYVLLNEIIFRLKSHFELAKQQPHYESAMLACQLFLNEKLQEKRLVQSKHSYREEFIDKSSQASSLRDVAKKLSPTAVQNLLISAEEIDLLEQYLDFRETLANFLNNDYEELTLTEISNEIQVHDPIEWNVVMRDLSTLSTENYHQGQTVPYNIINSVTQPMRHIPTFVQGLLDKKSKEKREHLLTRMAELETKTNDIIHTLSDNENSWLRLQFCADSNAFGVDMKNTEAKLVNPSMEPGIFNPQKLKQAIKKDDESVVSYGLLFVLGIKSAKGSLSVSQGSLIFWKNKLNLEKSPNVQELTFKVVGSTLKSSGIDTFKNLAFSKFGGVPDTHVIIGGTIQPHHLFAHLTGSNKRRAEFALKHVSDAILNGDKPKSTYLKELEKHASSGTHTSKSEQRNTIVTDRKTGATVGVTTRAGVSTLIQHYIDGSSSIEDLKRLEMKVLIVPRADIPTQIAHHYTDNSPLIGTQGLKLGKMGTYAKQFHHSVPGAIFLLDGMLAAYTYLNYENEFKDGNAGYNITKHAAFISELTVSTATVFEAYVSDKTRISQGLFTKNTRIINTLLRPYAIEIKITPLSIATGIAGLIGTAVVAWDAWHLLQKNDNDAAIFGFMSAGAAGITSVLLAFSIGGPVVWAFIIASVLFGAISSFLINSDMDNWAEFGPFGKNEDNRLKGYSAFANGKVYHNFIISLLFSPGVTIKRLGSTNNFTISIHIPLYGDFDTDAYLDVEVVEHIRVGNTITPKSYNVPINHNVIDKNMRHKIAEPVEYRNQKGIVERFDYQAFFDLDTVSTSISFLKSASTEVVSIHAKASIMKNNITYPQDLKAYRDKKASDDDVKTKDDIINKAAEKKDWAKDIYRTGLVYRIGEIFD